jgi:hypothetical protein
MLQRELYLGPARFPIPAWMPLIKLFRRGRDCSSVFIHMFLHQKLLMKEKSVCLEHLGRLKIAAIGYQFYVPNLLTYQTYYLPFALST